MFCHVYMFMLFFSCKSLPLFFVCLSKFIPSIWRQWVPTSGSTKTWCHSWTSNLENSSKLSISLEPALKPLWWKSHISAKVPRDRTLDQKSADELSHMNCCRVCFGKTSQGITDKNLWLSIARFIWSPPNTLDRVQWQDNPDSPQARGTFKMLICTVMRWLLLLLSWKSNHVKIIMACLKVLSVSFPFFFLQRHRCKWIKKKSAQLPRVLLKQCAHVK